jgi:hypothetical protein
MRAASRSVYPSGIDLQAHFGTDGVRGIHDVAGALFSTVRQRRGGLTLIGRR